jgi:hypothetical protein
MYLFSFLFSLFFFSRILFKPMFLYIIILCIFNSMLLYTYYIISLRMLINIVNYKLEKLVSDPYVLYLANKNMFKLLFANKIIWVLCTIKSIILMHVYYNTPTRVSHDITEILLKVALNTINQTYYD